MPSRVTQARPDDRDEPGQDDFEQRMAGVSRLRGRGRLVEDTVVRARHGAAGREGNAGGKRAGKAGSPPSGSRIEVGSVAGLNRRQADALRGGDIAIDARLDLHGGQGAFYVLLRRSRGADSPAKG